MPKTALCFGDSNTFGLMPNPFPWTRQRWKRSECWPAAMAEMSGLEVICEGLPGRTVTSSNHDAPHLDALSTVPALMESHTPLDIVIVMLGTNDLQASLNLTPEAITIGMATIVKALKRSERVVGSAAPKILVIAPPPVREVGFRSVTFAGASAKSRAIPGLYQQMAEALEVGFLDAGQHAAVSDIDGIHLDVAEHLKLARAISQRLDTL